MAMSLFKRRPKVDIQIIKTESLKKPKDAEEREGVESAAVSDVSINILGKQQLREQLSDEELQDVAEQIAQEAKEIARLTLPDIVQKAQEAQQAWQIDEAILTLRRHARRFGTGPEIEQELRNCLNALEGNTYFQRVANGQLAAILFDVAGFNILDKTPLEDLQDRPLLETRLTLACEDNDLRRTLDIMAGSPQRYYCYCLAEFERPLDDLTLGLVQEDFRRRERMVNSLVHFAVCKESSPATNMVINVHRFADNFITIPLERDEMRWAVLNDTAAGYLQSKVSAWVDNHRLFAATRPVARQGEFFGRENDLKQITGAVNGGQSFYVLGNRRMGKTSLIQHLHSLGAFRSHLYAFLGLENYLDQPNFDRAVEDILRQWSEALQHKNPKIAQKIQSQIPGDAPPHDRLSVFLDEVRSAIYKEQLDGRCLAILDDVNHVLYARDGRDSLWKRGAGQLVRLLRHRQELVITGLTLWDFEARDIVEREPSGGLGKYTPIYLGPLRREECDTMITYIGGIISMEFKPESLEAIYEETGGHPLWTRLLCDAISRTRRSRSERLVVTPTHVEQATTEFLSLDKRFLLQLLDSLKGAEQRALRELGRYTEPVNVAELAEPLSPEILMHLKYYGLIEEAPVGSARYRLRMRLLARYLQSQ
jgi:hypothetical protein